MESFAVGRSNRTSLLNFPKKYLDTLANSGVKYASKYPETRGHFQGMSDYGEFIRSKRGHMTLSDLATESGIHLSVLSRLESGERQPNLGHLQKLARAFGMSLPGLLKKVGK